MKNADRPTSTPATPSIFRIAAGAISLVAARFRFLLLVGGVLLLIGYWPDLKCFWERLMHPEPFPVSVSSTTEYWCPMCPGVVSDWPSKCPVCHMTLVRRLKGDMTPLPDGVVARLQLSPYRLQLAGIHTSAVEYRRLNHEIIAGGRLEPATLPLFANALLLLEVKLFASDAALLKSGQAVEIVSDALPGQTFSGSVVEAPRGWPEARATVLLDNSQGRLRPGQYATARFRLSASRLDAQRHAVLERWHNQTTVEMIVAGLDNHLGPAALPSLLNAGVRLALLDEDLVLSVPESAVIDTGTRKIVFVEHMAGMYDAVEIRLGRRYGDQYPVCSGLEPGQRVVTAGTVLLDAETRLNPSVAAGYFGAGSRLGAPPSSPPAPGTLSSEDRLIVERQKICPVSEAPLDSMGGPVRVIVNGRPVFICCEGCRDPLLKEPAKYMPRFDKPK